MSEEAAKRLKSTKRRWRNALEEWEVSTVKAMLQRGGPFTNESKHKSLKPTSDDDLDAFLVTWPDIDHETGLSVHGVELLIKARETMIAAVQTFNSAGHTFRAELLL